MSPVKAAVMSILTMGLYDLCFWWRHWRTQRQRGLEISVFWRTVFAGFVSFEYRTTLSIALVERGVAEPPLLGAAPSVYLLAMIISRGVSKLLHQPGLEILLTILFVLARAGALVVFQDAANQALGEGAQRGAFNRGASGRTYLAVAGGLLLWALTLLGMLAPELAAS
jgi:hypothetical protein